MFVTHASRHTRSARRAGAALLEFVICLPILVLLLLATIEANSMVFLKQSLTISAYEGGRTVLVPGATEADVVADCQQVIADRGIQGAQISIAPSNFVTLNAGEFIEVSVSAPCEQNAPFASWFYGGQTLAGRVEVMKEYD